MKKSVFLTFLFIFISLWSFQAKANPDDIKFLEPNSTGTVGLYEKLELGIVIPTNIKNSINSFFGLSGKEYNPLFINPYNPDSISIEATFKYLDNPSIPTQVIYGFYYREYKYSKIPIDNSTLWQDSSTIFNWRVRFAPKYAGNWNVKLIIKRGIKTVYNETTGKNFTCISSSSAGFLKVGSSNRFLRFQTDQPFYPIGLNIAWPDNNGNNNDIINNPLEIEKHKNLIKKLANAGGNYCRIVDTPYSYTIETSLLGIYDNRQPIMWEFDNVIQTAKEKNIYIHLSMDHSEYYIHSNWSRYSWDKNVYKENNDFDHKGIINVKKPYDFLTNEQAIKQYKKRIRYIIARWGYSTNIATFEIFNEALILNINDTLKCTGDVISLWHNKIATYIKSDLKHIDHLISTSLNGELWTIDNDPIIDFTSIHPYDNWKRNGNIGLAESVKWVQSNTLLNNPKKPCFIGEMGGGHGGYMDTLDVFYHNILWGSAFTGSLGAGLDWWWWTDLSSTAFTKDIPVLKEFVKNIDFDREKYYSQNNRNDDFNSSTYNNNHLEAITLTNNDGINSNKAVGWVHNRSHYYYNLVDRICGNYFNQNVFDEFWTYSYTDTAGVIHNRNYGLPPDDDSITCPVDVANEPVTVNNMNPNTFYEVNWFNTKNLEKMKMEIVSSNSTGGLIINPPNMDYMNYDYAYTISCNPSVGWSEKKTCPGQFNSVITNSELETDNGSHIFYINSNKQVCSLYKTTDSYGIAGYGDGPLTINAMTASQNSGILFNLTDNCLYYVGTDSKIYKFSYIIDKWINTQVCPGQWNSTMLNSDLVTNGPSIYYINTNNQVCTLYKNGSTWGDAILNSSAPKSISNGRGLLFNSSDGGVYYVGSDNYIWKLYFNGTWQYQKVCSGQWNKVLTGSELKADGTFSTIYYINSNYNICALYKNGTNWGDALLSNIQVKSNSHFTSKDIAYFIGIDNNLYKLSYTSSGWKSEPLLQVGSCQQFTNSGILATSSNIYYTGLDNYIHDLSEGNNILPFTVKGSNIGHSNSWDVNGLDGADVAYKVCVDVSTNITATLWDPVTNYDSKLEIFNANGTSTGYYNDDASGCGLKSTISSATLIPGCYYFVVDGYNGATGNYILTITKNSTKSAMIADDKNKDVKKENLNKEINDEANEPIIYPNPSANNINVILPKVGYYKLQIININGFVVKEFTVNLKEISIDCSNLQSGFYVLRTLNSESVYNSKFQIQK